ncbi:hypothetical protein BV22DRAFT_996428, partial [Leucogyrophana mollusca]
YLGACTPHGQDYIEVLFISQFFPDITRYAWRYTELLYWSTMYPTHHCPTDVVGGACLATTFFYLMPENLRADGAALP